MDPGQEASKKGVCVFVRVCVCVCVRERLNRQTRRDRQTDRDKDRQTDRQTDRRTEGTVLHINSSLQWAAVAGGCEGTAGG